MKSRLPEDMELGELAAKVSEMAEWLDRAFDANCAETDYTDGCASCDAGMAIEHLRKIKASLKPFIPS